MAAYKDYYQTLGIGRSATDKEIRSAFRKLAAKHHPDKNPGDAAAEERFKEVNEAYTVLSDPEKRKVYDQYGSAGGPPPFTGQPGGFTGTWTTGGEAGDFSDFFQQLFGGRVAGGGGSRFSSFGTSPQGDPFGGFGQSGFNQSGFSGATAPARQDVQGEILISLEEAYHGGSRTLSIGSEGGGRRIEVKLPKGARHGSKLRLRGQAPGGGDVYLHVKLEPHPLYTLDGDDVRVLLKVPDYMAALGGTVRVPTLGGEVDMTLPGGTQSGRTLRLRGRGWPKKDGTQGDVLAEVRVVIPGRLSEAQLELYERLRDLSEASAQAAD